MQAIISWTITGSWLAFVGYWRYASQSVKQTTAQETGGSRAVHLGLLALGFGLVFLPLGIGPLGWRILPATAPDTAVVTAVGALLTLLGVGFAIWARAALGQNWSGIVTLKAAHQLIRRGPYALVRHPIYTGLLLALLGTAMVGGELRGLLAILIVTLAYWRKSRLEETYLVRQFGAAYQAYQREVKALIPFVL